MALQHLRASTANKRPTPAAMADGQLAMNTNLASAGLFFKDSNGDLVKVGPVHVGTTAPNVSPASGGQTGNSKGEQWLDTSGANPVLKIWDGSAWQSEASEFLNAAGDTMTGPLGVPLGSDSAPSIYPGSDTDTGLYSPGANQIALSTAGNQRLVIDSNGQIKAKSLGTAALPVWSFVDDVNTGIWSPAADQLAISTNGVERVEWGTSEVVFNDGGANYDFRIEGDTEANLLFVDASADFVGIRTNAPGVALHVDGDIRCDGVYGETDTNTSIKFPGSDVITFNEGGAEAARIDSSGRLLVGTSTANGNGLLQVNGGYNILKGFNRRPPLHRGSLFTKTAATTLSVVADCSLNGFFYDAATAVTMPSHSNNTDYAIWQNPTTGALVGNASFTSAPSGATGGSIVGGYHYIPSGRPTAVNNGSPTGAAEILEFSLWDLTWRPACPDPRGMACIESGFWIDLYMCGATSYAGSTFSAVPSSRIGLTIADGNSPPLIPAQYGGNGSTAYGNGKWYVFAEVARSFGKKLPSYSEFAAAAFGAPEAGSRGTDPGTVIWERVSKFGLAQATGTLWTWAEETATSSAPTAWTTGSETESRGQVFGSPTRALRLGGNWLSTSNAGSRSANWDFNPWDGDGGIGARFVAGHLVLG